MPHLIVSTRIIGWNKYLSHFSNVSTDQWLIFVLLVYTYLFLSRCARLSWTQMNLPASTSFGFCCNSLRLKLLFRDFADTIPQKVKQMKSSFHRCTWLRKYLCDASISCLVVYLPNLIIYSHFLFSCGYSFQPIQRILFWLGLLPPPLKRTALLPRHNRSMYIQPQAYNPTCAPLPRPPRWTPIASGPNGQVTSLHNG